MSEQDAAGEGAPRRRWVKPVLIISLALNLLFVGLMAGSIWKHRHGKRWVSKHKAFEATVEQVIKEFPQSKRTTAEQVLERLRGEVIPRAGGRREARRAVVDALLAEPYREKALREALAEFRKLRADVQLGLHTLALELVRDMTLAERKRLLEIFRSKRGRRGRHRAKGEE